MGFDCTKVTHDLIHEGTGPLPRLGRDREVLLDDQPVELGEQVPVDLAVWEGAREARRVRDCLQFCGRKQFDPIAAETDGRRIVGPIEGTQMDHARRPGGQRKMKPLRRFLDRQSEIATFLGQIERAAERAQNLRKREAEPELGADAVRFLACRLETQELRRLEPVVRPLATHIPKVIDRI